MLHLFSHGAFIHTYAAYVLADTCQLRMGEEAGLEEPSKWCSLTPCSQFGNAKTADHCPDFKLLS